MGSATSIDANKILEQSYKIKEQEEKIHSLESELNSLKSVCDIHLLSKSVTEEIKKTKDNKDYEYLVLSNGGGINGIGFATGVISALEQLNIIPKLKGIAGTSFSVIIIALFAIGYTSQEIIDIVDDLDFSNFLDGKSRLNSIENSGICFGNNLMTLMSKLIHKKTNDPDYTLSDLKKDKGISLVIVATEISTYKPVYFHADNPIRAYSDISIAIAIRMACGIPLYFEPYLYNNCYFADGSLSDNFPLCIFDNNNINTKTLGIKHVFTDISPSSIAFTNIQTYFTAVIDMFMLANGKQHLAPDLRIRTIPINIPNNAFKFNLSKKDKQHLIDISKQQTIDFFKS